MTMKIFGAALIVSGGFFLGWIPALHNKKRLQTLIEFKTAFDEFYVDLCERRGSIESFLLKNRELTEFLGANRSYKWLLKEDQTLLNQAIKRIKSGSYQEAMNCCKELIEKMSDIVRNLTVNEQTTGKALPLVTGAIGFLLAVLLF